MTEQLVECIPNFSEGRDRQIIRWIAGAIESVEGVRLLSVDSGFEVNRTVVTFIGAPAPVLEAAFRAISKAAELIDMRNHKGAHPRMGATDVCPLVPISNISVEECVRLSRSLGQRVGDELGIPVYLYEKSAQGRARKDLAYLRTGEYEGLEARFAEPAWKPDFGPAEFNPRSGATAIGVREILIAYNINLNTREAKFATDIALALRTKGRSARRGNISPLYLEGEEILKYEADSYPCGKDEFVGRSLGETVEHCQREHGYDLINLLISHGISAEVPEGQSVKIPGRFPYCRALGWFVPEYDRVQVSINLTNYRVTSIHDVIEEVRRMAADRGLVVTGSEIIGMVPYLALRDAGIFYLRMQRQSWEIPIRDVLSTAVQSLGLSDVAEFKLTDRVLGLPSNLDELVLDQRQRSEN